MMVNSLVAGIRSLPSKIFLYTTSPRLPIGSDIMSPKIHFQCSLSTTSTSHSGVICVKQKFSGMLQVNGCNYNSSFVVLSLKNFSKMCHNSSFSNRSNVAFHPVHLRGFLAVICLPLLNSRQLLVRNRFHDRLCYNPLHCKICTHNKIEGCTGNGVIYSIKCLSYHVEYTVETVHPFHCRIVEHLRAMVSFSQISFEHVRCTAFDKFF